MGRGTAMILLIDTSSPICKVSFINGSKRVNETWQADRDLAKDLLGYLDTQFSAHGYSWSDISGIGVFQGPGSFTGLRIGMTVMNTIADSESVPIVGKRGDNWQEEALMALAAGENESIVMPFYGSDAHITLPRK
jgi:tRNA threonylcarbamoyladenosine biosynthesis protein TsaB